MRNLTPGVTVIITSNAQTFGWLMRLRWPFRARLADLVEAGTRSGDAA